MVDCTKLDIGNAIPKPPNLQAYVPNLANSAAILGDVHRRITLPNMAKLAVKAIYDEIASFESSLDGDDELGMPIVGGPSGLCVHVRKVYRFGTDKLVFVGIDSEHRPVRLIQHLSQLNFLMLAAPKLGPIAVRLGFHSPAGTPAE